jgi:hypothetical protein
VERVQQVKQVIMQGAAERAWSTRVEVTYGLAWDYQRQAWVAPDDFGYVPSEERVTKNEHQGQNTPSGR